jgi:hypothetical protein
MAIGKVFIKTRIMTLFAAALAGLSFHPSSLRAAETNAAPERIGVYDSRLIAYASFWTEAHQRKLNDLVKEARAAGTAGETNRFRELEAALKQEQERGHLQVFSTAPVDEILAGMKERVAAVRQETGVSLLVSKWDEQTLSEHRRARRVDVTDPLLRDFKLTDKQKKVIEEMRKQPPLPLKEAQELMRSGKL